MSHDGDEDGYCWWTTLARTSPCTSSSPNPSSERISKLCWPIPGRASFGPPSASGPQRSNGPICSNQPHSGVAYRGDPPQLAVEGVVQDPLPEAVPVGRLDRLGEDAGRGERLHPLGGGAGGECAGQDLFGLAGNLVARAAAEGDVVVGKSGERGDRSATPPTPRPSGSRRRTSRHRRPGRGGIPARSRSAPSRVRGRGRSARLLGSRRSGGACPRPSGSSPPGIPCRRTPRRRGRPARRSPRPNRRTCRSGSTCPRSGRCPHRRRPARIRSGPASRRRCRDRSRGPQSCRTRWHGSRRPAG